MPREKTTVAELLESVGCDNGDVGDERDFEVLVEMELGDEPERFRVTSTRFSELEGKHYLVVTAGAPK